MATEAELRLLQKWVEAEEATDRARDAANEAQKRYETAANASNELEKQVHGLLNAQQPHRLIPIGAGKVVRITKGSYGPTAFVDQLEPITDIPVGREQE